MRIGVGVPHVATRIDHHMDHVAAAAARGMGPRWLRDTECLVRALNLLLLSPMKWACEAVVIPSLAHFMGDGAMGGP